MWKIVVLTGLLMFTACFGEDRSMEKDKEKFFKGLDEYFHQEKMRTENMVYFGREVKYSPDGKYIAFQVIIKNTEYIYLFDRKAEKVIRGFWGDYYNCSEMTFNREGDNLLFMTGYWLNNEHSKGNFFVQVMNLEGKNRKIILKPEQAATYPVYSQDGKKIYFSEFLEDAEKLHYMEFEKGKDEVLINTNLGNIGGIVPLADGSNIIFTARGNVYNYNLSNSELKMIAPYDHLYGLVYSDHYKDHMLVQKADEKRAGIHDLNLETGKIKLLYYIDISDSGDHNNFNLSPDGKKILYTDKYNLSAASSTNLIKEMNIDGSGLRVLPVDLKKLKEVPVVNIDEGFDWRK